MRIVLSLVKPIYLPSQIKLLKFNDKFNSSFIYFIFLAIILSFLPGIILNFQFFASLSDYNYKQQKQKTRFANRMAFSKEELKYYLTNFRTRKSYFVFQVFQLVLSIVIITCAMLSDDLFRQPLVLWLEFTLLFCMAFDLYSLFNVRFVVRLVTEGSIWKTKTNKIDLVIFIIFLSTFVFMCLTENKVRQGNPLDYQIIIETDDILVIGIIVCRYAVQIYQMVKTIQNTQKNISCQRKMKDIDLNKDPHVSIVDDNHDHAEEVIKQRIQSKKLLKSHQKSDQSNDTR